MGELDVKLRKRYTRVIWYEVLLDGDMVGSLFLDKSDGEPLPKGVRRYAPFVGRGNFLLPKGTLDENVEYLTRLFRKGRLGKPPRSDADVMLEALALRGLELEPSHKKLVVAQAETLEKKYDVDDVEDQVYRKIWSFEEAEAAREAIDWREYDGPQPWSLVDDAKAEKR